jgi:intracellular sulfur oxidation DsrE/DsrF family protein
MTSSLDRSSAVPRRGFVARLVSGAAALATVGAGGAPHLSGAETRRVPVPADDWMASLTGKHRTVFDLSSHRGGKPLAQAKNYLDAWRDAFQMPERDVNLVIGVHGDGFPIVAGDALWTRYRLGEQYEVTDGETKGPAVRNVFSTAHAAPSGLVSVEQSIEALQRRGVRFIVCNNTIAGATRRLAAAGLGGGDEIRAALVAGLLPGVIVVPAMVVALTQLQERGLSYTKIS